MKVLSGLALAALPLAPPPEQIPMGNLFVDLRARLLLPKPRRAGRESSRPRARRFWRSSRRCCSLVFFAARVALRRRRRRSSPSRFCAFDPNLLAHAGVVHTDLGAALAFLATVLAWDARRDGGRRAGRLALAAACLGLALDDEVLRRSTSCPSSCSRPCSAARRGGGRGARGWAATCAAPGASRASARSLVVLAVYAPVTVAHGPRRPGSVIREKVGGRRASAGVWPSGSSRWRTSRRRWRTTSAASPPSRGRTRSAEASRS